MGLMEDFTRDMEERSVRNDELTAISALAKRQQILEKDVKSMELALSGLKDELREVQEVLLPNAMASVGMEEFKLASGEKITVKDDVYASIRKDFYNNAIHWLDENGLGDVVKDKVSVNFGRGENDLAQALVDHCLNEGYSVQEALSVHPQTLKALVKEQLAQGVEFPEKFFSVTPVKRAIIKTK